MKRWTKGTAAALAAALSVVLGSGAGAAQLPAAEMTRQTTAPAPAGFARAYRQRSGKAAGIRVNIRRGSLPEGSRISLYAGKTWLQSFVLTDAVATAPLVPGRYWIAAETGEKVSFTLRENGSVGRVAGQGWSDEEQLWLTAGRAPDREA